MSGKQEIEEYAQRLRKRITRDDRELFHVHTRRCGHAGDYEDREYIDRAIMMGATKITFTDHAPFPGDPFGSRMRMRDLPEYISSMKNLQKEYLGQIEIDAGLEIEYLRDFHDYYKALRDMDGIGYMLLGQHIYEIEPKRYNFSLPPEEKAHTEMTGCGKAIIEGIQSGFFDAVAHPDRIFRRRKEWDAEAEHIAREIIEAVCRAHIPLEVNESSIRKKNQFRPEFWEIAEEMNVSYLHGLDAHSPDELEYRRSSTDRRSK